MITDLNSYGSVLAAYEGTGLVSANGDSLECHFAAGQFRNGDVVVLCYFAHPESGIRFDVFDESPDKIEGTTREGWRFLATGDLDWRNWLPNRSDEADDYPVAFRTQRIIVQRIGEKPNRGISYGITNFHYRHAFSTLVFINDLAITLEIAPLPDAEDRLLRLMTVKDTVITTEVRIIDPPGLATVYAEEAIDDFCHVASVALGTQVQWVCMRRPDAVLGCDVREHYGRFTKPYCGLHAIDNRSGYSSELPQFIQSALPRYRELKMGWGLHRGPIAAYIDAKSEGDLLEQRGVKLCVAIECLKSAFVEACNVPEYVVKPNRFKKLVRGLKEACKIVLAAEECQAEEIDSLCAKFSELNRHSFRFVLKKLADFVKLRPSDQEWNQFVDNRNSLIHSAKFASARPVDDWRFLVNMLDRFYLKLLGYSGPYINLARPQNEHRDMLE